MHAPGFQIPPQLRIVIAYSLGEDGLRWGQQLEDLVAQCAQKWDLRVGPPYEPGGLTAWVAPAIQRDTIPVVLKLSYPDPETAHEGEALKVYGGDGAVLVFDTDASGNALLLERCETGEPLEKLPDLHQAFEVACDLIERLWKPLPRSHPFDLVRDRAVQWSAAIADEFQALGQPFEATVADRAVSLLSEIAAISDDSPVLLHQDFHLGNVLRAQREDWLAIDPKPLAGQRSFGVSGLLLSQRQTVLTSTNPRREASRKLGELVDRFDLELDLVRAWTFGQAVRFGLWRRKGSDSRWREFVTYGQLLDEASA
jgi:streptomycin 6-kinase